MADRIDAVPDHVAVAVPDFDVADARWRDDLGARLVAGFHAHGRFRSRQSRFRGGAKLELLMPSELDPSDDNFVRRFLARFGASVHHVTLKVPDLHQAIDTLRGVGLDVVDVDDSGQTWKEGFLRPSQVGGMIVQIAYAANSDEQIAANQGRVLEEPPADGARLLGPLLRHPDLDRASWVWTTLGATVTRDADALTAAWQGAPLTIRIEHGEAAGPVGLRFEGLAGDLPAHPDLGAAALRV